MRCLPQVGGAKGIAPSNADEWLAEATRRWGGRVADVSCEDWGAYVKSRISRPPPPSPMELLQEFYAHDPWQLLVRALHFPSPAHLLMQNSDAFVGRRSRAC